MKNDEAILRTMSNNTHVTNVGGSAHQLMDLV